MADEGGVLCSFFPYGLGGLVFAGAVCAPMFGPHSKIPEPWPRLLIS